MQRQNVTARFGTANGVKNGASSAGSLAVRGCLFLGQGVGVALVCLVAWGRGVLAGVGRCRGAAPRRP